MDFAYLLFLPTVAMQTRCGRFLRRKCNSPAHFGFAAGISIVARHTAVRLFTFQKTHSVRSSFRNAVYASCMQKIANRLYEREQQWVSLDKLNWHISC